MNEGRDHKLTGDRYSHHHHDTLLQSRNVPEDTADKHAAPVSKLTQPPADPSINVAPEEKKIFTVPSKCPSTGTQPITSEQCNRFCFSQYIIQKTKETCNNTQKPVAILCLMILLPLAISIFFQSFCIKCKPVGTFCLA